MKRLLTGAILVAQQLMGAAQTPQTVSVDAQLRTRAEYRNGAVAPLSEDDKAATFVNERARLGVQFDRGDLTMRLSAQHTGVWGQDPQVDKQGRIAVSEAWARMAFGDHFFAQIGRQALVYDDERLLGGLDWNVAGRTHDALRVGYQAGDHQAHLIVAVNQNDELTRQTYYDSSEGQPYKSMQTVWYHYDGHQMGVPFDASVLLLNLGYEMGNSTTGESDVKHMLTLGTHFNVVPPVEGLKLTGSFYYQTGNTMAAWMASLKAAYQIDDAWTVHAAYDYLSGDDDLLDGKMKCFDPLYGTHHKFYGSMDLFYSPTFRISDSYGLQDIQASVQSKHFKRVPMQLTYHYFATASKVPGQDAILGLGHEVDYQLSYQLTKEVGLSAGYSFMIGQHTMDIVKGGDHSRWQDWGWAMVSVKL